MAELRFKQITDKLNEELAGENWKLINAFGQSLET